MRKIVSFLSSSSSAATELATESTLVVAIASAVFLRSTTLNQDQNSAWKTLHLAPSRRRVNTSKFIELHRQSISKKEAKRSLVMGTRSRIIIVSVSFPYKFYEVVS